MHHTVCRVSYNGPWLWHITFYLYLWVLEVFMVWKQKTERNCSKNYGCTDTTYPFQNTSGCIGCVTAPTKKDTFPRTTIFKTMQSGTTYIENNAIYNHSISVWTVVLCGMTELWFCSYWLTARDWWTNGLGLFHFLVCSIMLFLWAYTSCWSLKLSLI